MNNSLFRILIISAAVLWTAAAAVAANGPQKIIVFPLHGSPENRSLEWVGEGIAASLSIQLQGPMVRVMDGARVAEYMEGRGFRRGVQPSRGSLISIAQKASADLAVMGTFRGTERNLSVSVRVLHLEALRLSGNIAANGPLAALPQMENELAWQILTEIDTERFVSREEFYERTRQVPNSALALYIQSLGAPGENERRRLLLRALDIFSAFPEAQLQLGMYYYRKNDCESALRHLASAAGENDSSMAGAFSIGTCYLKTKEMEMAIETYLRILQNSRPYEVLNNLGIAYLRRNESQPAINAFSEAHTLAPDDSAVSLNLAIALQINGDASRARSIVEKAVALDSNNGMLHFILGFLLEEQGEGQSAVRVLQEASNLGIHTKQLLKQDPKTWLQLLPALSSENPVKGPMSNVKSPGNF